MRLIYNDRNGRKKIQELKKEIEELQAKAELLEKENNSNLQEARYFKTQTVELTMEKETDNKQKEQLQNKIIELQGKNTKLIEEIKKYKKGKVIQSKQITKFRNHKKRLQATINNQKKGWATTTTRKQILVDQIITNISKLFEKNFLPANSSIRRAFLNRITQNCSKVDAAKLLNVNINTIYGSKNCKPIHDINQSYYQRDSTEIDKRKKESVFFIHDHVPNLSGRDYKVLPYTFKNLYISYVARMKERALGKTTFDKIVKTFNIRRQKNPNFCEYCFRRKELQAKEENHTITEEESREIPKLDEHMANARAQQRHFENLRKRIEDGEKILIMLYDFSKFQNICVKDFQDLVCVFYFGKTENGKTKLQRKYVHCLLKPGVKNDSVAMKAFHEEIFNFDPATSPRDCLSFMKEKYDTIYILSDGCCKHFKSGVSFFLLYPFVEKLAEKGTTVIREFFPSNHGASAADSAASIAKRSCGNVSRYFSLSYILINKIERETWKQTI